MADRADLKNHIMSSEIVIFLPGEHSIREGRRLRAEPSAKGWVQLFVSKRTEGYRECELCLLAGNEV